ncbi:MAG: iron ABC transporter substrate-binding protein [Thermoleophilia bacterium]|nr:iron ABC transporter substrate-binding protein [Thermoleophilia bacterium]MDH5333657.1 iron ABC transporter substrate-binding protein [Thermoleophilia bacterium]
MKVLTLTVVLAATLATAACGGGDGSGPLTVYSGREEELVAPLFEMFTEATGIDVEVRYGDSAELAAAINEEGGNSPADVFFAQDPGSLGAVDAELTELPTDVLDRVDRRFRDDGGRWVGTSGRSRVLVYNTDALSEADLPGSVFDLTDPVWKGRIGIAPTNASFQAFVTAMRLAAGDERTRAWLEGLKANDPKTYEKNTPIVEAVAAGEVDVGLVNHYYLYLVREEQPAAPIANHFFDPADPGALVSVAGAGALASSNQPDDAQRFVEFLLSEEAQRFYVEDAEEAEYPLVAGIPAAEGLPPIEQLQGPDVDLSSFGGELASTIEMLRETGYLT